MLEMAGRSEAINLNRNLHGRLHVVFTLLNADRVLPRVAPVEWLAEDVEGLPTRAPGIALTNTTEHAQNKKMKQQTKKRRCFLQLRRRERRCEGGVIHQEQLSRPAPDSAISKLSQSACPPETLQPHADSNADIDNSIRTEAWTRHFAAQTGTLA